MGSKIPGNLVIQEFRAVHGDRYDYSKFVYKNSSTKSVIICREHGEFLQPSTTHRKGVGCPKCALEASYKRQRALAEEFAKVFETRSREAHGNFYDYSKVVYETARKKVCIVCPIHGEFWQEPYNHIEGHGCAKCRADDNSVRNTNTKERFAATANERHDNRYEYNKVVYRSASENVIITCPKHGDFPMTPNVHLNGVGCPKCKKEEGAAKVSEEGGIRFRHKGGVIHKGKYNYDKAVYVNYDTPITITCPIHGDFKQSPDKHLSGCGCQRCGTHISYREDDLVEFLSKHTTVVRRDRKILKGKELDIYMPDKGIAVEYNGSLFHSEKYQENAKWHLRSKQDSCELLGIRLVHVSDSEDQDVVKLTLANMLGINRTRYFARSCTVAVEPHSEEISDFLDTKHLQGDVKKCVNVCLRYNGSLVGIGCFSKPSSARGVSKIGAYELRRYCSDGVVVGGLSRVIKNFLKHHTDCIEIVTYSDNRWFTGESYRRVGFKFVKNNPPDYKYVSVDRNKSIKHKGKMRRSYLAKTPDIHFDPALTEVENCHANGWYRVWDCGKKKWVMEV